MGKPIVQVVVEGGCVQDVFLFDEHGHPMVFELQLEDHDVPQEKPETV
jgi:hypothetical protein